MQIYTAVPVAPGIGKGVLRRMVYGDPPLNPQLYTISFSLQNGDAGHQLRRPASWMRYYKPVSRILFPGNAGTAIIYLYRKLLTGINLPTHQRYHRLTGASGEQPSTLTYMAFQHARFTPGPCYHDPP